MSAWAVENGTEVVPGQVIGYVGHSGDTGDDKYNHVHFQVGFSSYVEDPYLYLPQKPGK
jgi:murein DD-endopeptidase MepM/ murein hydrolase activator NlpD